MPNLIKPSDAEERWARMRKDAALMAKGLKDPDTAAARAGMTADQLLDFAASEEGSRVVMAEIDRMRDSGELAKAQALALLESLLTHSQALVDGGEVGAATAAKLMDTALKVSGLAEERAARLRAQMEDDAPKATIFILRPGDADPSPEKPNEHRIVIDLRHGQNNPRDVIDVTPSDEGGDDGA
ncbi:hypothetical protein [Aromatoleum bremense]|uniref:Terminase small subunit n=1 Tax=Aromatoleum bremense TaxID=76115 RepID=A0ABX1NZA8_9RHOO|nr:hypothetical protein [Aromatoleum bremense]NMG16742.1 hypothetical protein [Aromatoleum bremense]QTQ33026.1 Uncharacterized protein pbN1_30380 [Aromatoleum bremense]